MRANYNNLKKGVVADQSYLEAFFENLMYGGNNVLSNRAMHDIHPLEKKATHSGREQTILEYIKNNPGCSAVKISEDLNIPLRTVQRTIAGLSEKIERQPKQKGP